MTLLLAEQSLIVANPITCDSLSNWFKLPFHGVFDGNGIAFFYITRYSYGTHLLDSVVADGNGLSSRD